MLPDGQRTRVAPDHPRSGRADVLKQGLPPECRGPRDECPGPGPPFHVSEEAEVHLQGGRLGRAGGVRRDFQSRQGLARDDARAWTRCGVAGIGPSRRWGSSCAISPCRFEREHWNSLYETPLFRSALVLAVLAVPLSYWSPVSMGLVAVFFVVMVKGIPSREWLYASVAATACAFYFAWLHQLPPARLVTAAMVAAYQLWLIGLGLRRYEPELKAWLRLPGAGYDKPLYNSAILAALTAIGLRVNLGFLHDDDWFAAAGLALNLAGFCLLMIKAYPTKGWVHASVVLVTVSVGMEAYPRVTSPLSWLLIGMGLAILLSVAAKLGGRFASTLCRRFGIPDDDYAAVVELWRTPSSRSPPRSAHGRRRGLAPDDRPSAIAHRFREARPLVDDPGLAGAGMRLRRLRRGAGRAGPRR